MSSSETEDGGSATGQGTGSSAPNAIIEQVGPPGITIDAWLFFADTDIN